MIAFSMYNKAEKIFWACKHLIIAIIYKKL